MVPVASGTQDRAPLAGVSGKTYLATLLGLAPSGPAKVIFMGVLVSILSGILLYHIENRKFLYHAIQLRRLRPGFLTVKPFSVCVFPSTVCFAAADTCDFVPAFAKEATCAFSPRR